MRHSCFCSCERKLRLIDQFQRIAQRIAAAELVFDLAENFADLVFDCVGAFGAGPEAFQIGKQLVVDIFDEIVAGQRLVVIEEPSFLWAAQRPAVRLSMIGWYFLP